MVGEHVVGLAAVELIELRLGLPDGDELDPGTGDGRCPLREFGEQRGIYVEPSQQTLGEFLEEWLSAIHPTVRASTFDSYSRNLRNHVINHIGSQHLMKVDAGVLNRLSATLLASGRRPSSRL